jgi:hypothetical protein
MESAMTGTIVHLTRAALPGARPTIAQGARQALDQLPDTVLREMGLARDELPFVAVAVTSRGHQTGARRLRGPAMRELFRLANMMLAAVSKFADLSRAVLARRGFGLDGIQVCGIGCLVRRTGNRKNAVSWHISQRNMCSSRSGSSGAG